MKSVRGVFETTGDELVFAIDGVPLCGLGETALLIAVIMVFLPAINLGSCTQCRLKIFISFWASRTTRPR